MPARHTRGVYQRCVLSNSGYVLCQCHQGHRKRNAPSHVRGHIGSDLPGIPGRALRSFPVRLLQKKSLPESRPLWSSRQKTPRLRQRCRANLHTQPFGFIQAPMFAALNYGAALKNVIALGAGMCQGLGLGGQQRSGACDSRIGRDHPPCGSFRSVASYVVRLSGAGGSCADLYR